MPKVELTDEIRNDLKAIQMRNQIFSKRFYKNNDSNKLPEYFQMGTWLEANQRGVSKKRAKPGSIAAQFLKDDEAQGFSKRKYEKVNDKRRRMGEKKIKLRRNKEKAQRASKFQKKTISKKP